MSLVCNKFQARLSEELVVCSLDLNLWCMTDHVIYCSTTLQKTLHHLAVVDDDERIAPLLKTIKYVVASLLDKLQLKLAMSVSPLIYVIAFWSVICLVTFPRHRHLGEHFTDAGTQFFGKISLGQLDTVSRSAPVFLSHF